MDHMYTYSNFVEHIIISYVVVCYWKSSRIRIPIIFVQPKTNMRVPLRLFHLLPPIHPQ